MSKKQARNIQPAKPVGMKKLEHRGYVIVQSPRNHHVMIGKDGRTVYHASYDHALTDKELRQRVDDYITLADSLPPRHPHRRGRAGRRQHRREGRQNER